MGVCYAFNARLQSQLFKQTKYFDTFSNVFNISSPDVRMPTGFGPNAGFFLMIDTKRRLHPRTQPEVPICPVAPSNNYILSVSNGESSFDIGIEPQLIFKSVVLQC
jgi:hypothetical protein